MEIIKRKEGRNYILTCKHCESVSRYNEFSHDNMGRPELSHYEDMDDVMCVGYTCPVCGKHNSILEKDLSQYEERRIKKEVQNRKNKELFDKRDILEYIKVACAVGFLILVLINLFSNVI